MEIIECLKCSASFEVNPDESFVCCPCCGNVDFPETKLRSGFEINGFELKRKIGEGAMGQVWLAVQTSMQRNAAIKILSPSVCSRPGFLERFQGEIKNSAKLEHPNIITAFDAGCENGFYYLASSYVDGENLEQILAAKGRLDGYSALKIALGIAEALSYAWYEFNLLHRDIKPSNIIIDKNNIPKLMDMGISKCINDDPALTYDGEIVGTPYYMSPEQAKGRIDLDLRSDIYSLGATLYHLVTGVLPFDGTTSVGILTKHITETLIAPIDRNNLVSNDINLLIIKMMEKALDLRLQTWDQVITQIKVILENQENVKPGIVSESIEKTGAEKIPKKESVLKKAFKTTKIYKAPGNKSAKKNKSQSLVFKKSIVGLLLAAVLCFFLFLFFRYFTLSDFLLRINSDLNNFLGSIIFFTQKNIIHNKDYFQITPGINFGFIVIGYLVILPFLLSGFWSGAKAQKNRKLFFFHFLGGIFLPFVYPIFIYGVKNKKIMNRRTDEIGEKKTIKYFHKLSKKVKESCFEFELYDDSKIYAERIIEVRESMLVLQVYSEGGDSRPLRIPYSSIKKYMKL
jgi:serine/threonine protein kinase